jgi:hypothetical protein
MSEPANVEADQATQKAEVIVHKDVKRKWVCNQFHIYVTIDSLNCVKPCLMQFAFKLNSRWQISYIWDTLDKDPEERKFLFKLDAAILTFASLGERHKSLVSIID